MIKYHSSPAFYKIASENVWFGKCIAATVDIRSHNCVFALCHHFCKCCTMIMKKTTFPNNLLNRCANNFGYSFTYIFFGSCILLYTCYVQERQ